MNEKWTIDTSEGRIWLTRYDNEDISIWSPPRSPQADLVAELVKGRAAWKPKFRAWFIPAVTADAIIAELEGL